MRVERIQAVPFHKIDTVTLSKLLQVETTSIDSYIDSVIKKKFQDLTCREVENIGNIRAYIYKQGKIEHVLAMLEYELSDVRTTLTYLYTTLENNSGGLADFICSNHQIMDNSTIESLYATINRSIDKSTKAGYIRDSESAKISKWALARIYELQNNPQVISAMDLYRRLKY